MTWDPGPTLTFLQATLAATNAFPGGVQIGEPFSAPAALVAAISLLEWEPSQTTLGSTIDVWTLQVRIYARAGMTPVDAGTVELAVAQGVSAVATALAGAFTLGGTVRAIDWAGEEMGRKVVIKWGHLVLDGSIFRMVDVVLPVIVDDAATFVA